MNKRLQCLILAVILLFGSGRYDGMIVLVLLILLFLVFSFEKVFSTAAGTSAGLLVGCLQE